MEQEYVVVLNRGQGRCAYVTRIVTLKESELDSFKFKWCEYIQSVNLKEVWDEKQKAMKAPEFYIVRQTHEQSLRRKQAFNKLHTAYKKQNM